VYQSLQYFFKPANIYPKLYDIDISEELDELYTINKHYLIMSDAGKPIYTRYGDENMLAPFFATLAAIIPKVEHYFSTSQYKGGSDKNHLKRIECGKFTFYVM